MDFDRSTSIVSWWLSSVGKIDIQFKPGVLAQLLRASPHRRHVVAALIAINTYESRDVYSAEVAEAVAQLAAGRLAANYAVSSPKGFMGALARVSDHIQPASFYRLLF